MSIILNDSFIQKLEKFNIKSRHLVEGFMIGLHKSPYHGFSVEFSDHRQYNQGDSVKNIDWKLFGKTERFFVKRFEEETNLKSYILIDHSKSMEFTSDGISKLDFAKEMASALSYLMLMQQDAVGLVTFTDKMTGYLPPKAVRSHYNLINKKLLQLQPEGKTNTSQILHDLAHRITRRGLIILISDLIDEPESIMKGLQHFRYLKNDVIVFHIADNEELNFRYKKEAKFVDLESNESVVINPWQIRNEYLNSMNSFYSHLKSECNKNKIEYNVINTKTSSDYILLNYLIKRGKLL